MNGEDFDAPFGAEADFNHDFDAPFEEDFDAPFGAVNRQDSNGGKSYRSVQTSFTKKGRGWECRGCSLLNDTHCDRCALCGGDRHVQVDDESDTDNADTNRQEHTTPLAAANNLEAKTHQQTEERIPSSPNSKSSKESHSEKSKRSEKSGKSERSKRGAIDPPAADGSNEGAENPPGGDADEKGGSRRRASTQGGGLRGSRRASRTGPLAKEGERDPNGSNEADAEAPASAASASRFGRTETGARAKEEEEKNRGRRASRTGPRAKEGEGNRNESKEKDADAPASGLRSGRTGARAKGEEKKKRGGSKKKGTEAPAPAIADSALNPEEAAEALSSLPGAPALPGEGTTRAIAQLLGLTQDMSLNGADGDNSKNSRSQASSNQKSSKSNAAGKQHQKEKQRRRTTFSKDVEDIDNAIKLNKKIRGDREKVDKIKAIKRGGVDPLQDADEEGDEKKESSGLRAGAKPFLPSFGNAEAETAGERQKQNAKKQDEKGGGKCKNKNKREPKQTGSSEDKNDNKQQPTPSREAKPSDGTDGKHGDKSPRKNKPQHQQNKGEAASGVNLTLQAIQQSKLQKKASTGKHTKKDNARTDPKLAEDKSKKDKDGRKSPTKQHKATDKAAQETTKPIETKPQKNEEKGQKKEKSNPKAKTKAATAEAPSNALSPAIPPNQPQTTNDLNYGAGRPIVVVHIAEKPSIAQAIAHGLNGGGPAKSVGKGLPTHEFVDPPFPKAPKASKVTHRVSSVAGHVFNVDFPAEYQSWDSIDPAELFHAPLVKKPCKGSVVKHLQDIAKGADFMVLWMDCDREGENINFEVLDCCMHLMQGSAHFDRVYRAHFSAINPSDITKAYNKLGKPDRNQSLSVDARQELDLKIGVAFSRFQTRYFQGRYGDLDSAVLSYGPCQTPTLGFCVQRHLDIETFKPEPFWTLDLGIMHKGTMCRAVWDSGRSFNQNKVQELIMKCKDASPAATVKVVSTVAKEKKQGRPVPLNTVALLKACSKSLGIGPHAALSTAERLYLSGYLSYPRTESTKYPASFDIQGTLKSQTSDSRWGQYVTELLQNGPNVGKGGVDMGDHPPITPCRHARAGELSGDMARVYDLVARHFIASVSDDAIWKSTTVNLSIEELGEKGNFTIRGKQLVTPGFLAIVLFKQYGDEPDAGDDVEDEEEEKVLPEFEVGNQFELSFPVLAKSGKVSVISGSGKLATLDIKEGKTTPPTYLTESELISKMEKNGIGTDASISTHIENILKRNYVELMPGRKLKPSRLGLVLAQGYHLIDDSLVLPKIRSEIENECVKIAKGLADRDAVVRRAIEIFSTKFHNFVQDINKMDVLFGSSFAQLQDVGKPFTRCGLTRRYLQFIPGPPPRLYNKTTETVYPLPIGGEIKQWTGRNCSVDGCGFELCLYSVGAPSRTFPLCPNCFNNPKPEWGPVPGESITKSGVDEDDEAKEQNIRRLAGKNMIRECPHPDEHPLIAEMTVSPDPESDGVLILDPHLGPKWRLVSTREPTIVHMPKCVDKITILDKEDEVFGCHLMSIEFKAGESPIEGKAKYTSCFANDEILQGLVRVHHGDEKTKSTSMHGKGRGRGGRGHGRGRGSGRGRGHR